MMTKLPPLPAMCHTAGAMLSHTIRSEGDTPRRHFIAVCEYEDCTREFDGKTWRVTVDKRVAPKTAR
jgi:hypothetical protein